MASGQIDVLRELEEIKKLAPTDFEGAVKRMGVLGLSEAQARENLSAYQQKVVPKNMADPTGKWEGTVSGPDNIAGAPLQQMKTPPQQAPTQQAAPAQPAAPPTTPLPSSQFNPSQYTQPSIDWNGIRNRATSETDLQLAYLREQAGTQLGRYKTSAQNALGTLRSQYAPQYQNIREGTELSARDALQRSAARGFMNSGLATDAELKARLAGQEAHTNLKGQELAATNAIQNQILQAEQEYNDTMGGLDQRRGDMIQQLIDRYGQQMLDNDFRERNMSSQLALQLLGMDTDWQKFQQGMDWDKNRYAQDDAWRREQWGGQMGLQQAGLAEQIAARMAQEQLTRDQMAQSGQQWRQQFDFNRDQTGVDNAFRQGQFDWQKEQAGIDNAFRRDQFSWQQGRAANDDALGWAQLGLQQQQHAMQNSWKEREFAMQDKQLSMAGKQMTAQYMQEIDDILNNPNRPDVMSMGLNNPQALLAHIQQRGLKIANEGADLQSLVDYINIRTGNPTTSTSGPRAMGNSLDFYFQSPTKKPRLNNGVPTNMFGR